MLLAVASLLSLLPLVAAPCGRCYIRTAPCGLHCSLLSLLLTRPLLGRPALSSSLIRVNPDEWSHVAASFDGKTLTTYCNGRRADTCTLDPVPQPDEYLHPKDGDLQVGGVKDKLAWDGYVDAVRLWNVSLTWEQIRQHMNDTLLGPQHPNLIGQWSCNEGAGIDCVDSSTRANHGVIDGDVKRVMCTRDRVEPTKTVSEEHIEQNFERLRKWRLEFEKRVGREVTQADLLLAGESIRKTARRLGLLG